MLTIAILLVGAAAVTYLWAYVVELFQRYLIPFARQLLGEKVAGLITDLIVFLDGKVCPTRQAVGRAWDAFRKHVLGCKTVYTKQGASQAEARTHTLVRTPDGRLMERTEVREVPWQDIPADIREQMIEAQRQQAALNNLELVERRMRERCAEVGYELST